MVAILMAVLIGCAALGVDVGRALLTQFRMQAATDAAALAGVASLPGDPTSAVNAAQSYAGLNGVTGASVTVSPDDMEITVTANQTVPTLLARVLGTLALPVAVTSHARAAAPPSCWGGACTASYPRYSGSESPSSPSCPQVYVGGAWTCAPPGSNQFGLAPLFVAASAIQPYFAPGGCAWTQAGCAADIFDLKSGNGSTGSNRGALSLDGNGANAFEQDLTSGAQTAVSVGGTVTTKPGNMSGPTDRGVAQLCENDNNHPYVVVPVVGRAPGQGRTTLPVVGFAAFAVTCPAPGDGQITGTFVAALLPGLGGTAGSGSGFGLNSRGGLVAS